MENLLLQDIRGEYIYPKVDFNAQTGVCSIVGESFMEETQKFYKPIFEWVKEYLKQATSIDFTFKLTYFNTSTSKWLTLILIELSKFKKSGNQVDITWYYFEEDVDMREEVQDYMQSTGLKINLITF